MIRRDVTALHRGSKSRPCLYYVTMCYRHTTLIAYQIGGLSSFCKANLRFRWSNSHPEHVSRSMSGYRTGQSDFPLTNLHPNMKNSPTKVVFLYYAIHFHFFVIGCDQFIEKISPSKKIKYPNKQFHKKFRIMSDYRYRIPLEKRYYIYN